MGKRGFILIIIVILLGTVLVFPRFLLLPRLEGALREYFRLELQAEKAEVKVLAPLGLEPLFGSLPQLEIALENAVLDDLMIESIMVDGRQIRFDPRRLYKEREFIYQGAQSLRMELEVTAQALNELFWFRLDPDRTMRFCLCPEEGVSLEGEMVIWNIPLDFKLAGVLEIQGDSALAFVPQHLEVEQTAVSPLLLEILDTYYGLRLDLESFPYPVTISDLKIGESRMTVWIEVSE